MEQGKIKDRIIYYELKKKDKDAFVEAYDLYVDDIYRFVYFKVSNAEEAQDIVSQVFLKSWNYIQDNRVKDFKTLKSLFYKVARNLVIDHYRKKSGREEMSLENKKGESIDIADDKQDSAKRLDIKIDMENLQEKMLELKDEYREVIVLRYLNEMSIAEMALVLDKRKGNIRVLIYRAIEALKKIIKKEENEE